jgi:hypothetical protein
MHGADVTNRADLEREPRDHAAAAAARRARTNRMTIVLALVAAAFYVGFIVMTVMQAK